MVTEAPTVRGHRRQFTRPGCCKLKCTSVDDAQLKPWVWWRGKTCNSLSSLDQPQGSRRQPAFDQNYSCSFFRDKLIWNKAKFTWFSRLPWVRTTPFGSPVVPLVYKTIAASLVKLLCKLPLRLILTSFVTSTGWNPSSTRGSPTSWTSTPRPSTCKQNIWPKMFRTIQLPNQRNLVSWASRAKDDFCTRVTEAVLYAGRRVGGTEGNCTRCDRSSKISSVRWDFRDDGLLPATAPAIQIPHCAATCWPPLGARRPTLRQRSWTIALAQFVQTLLLREDIKRQVLTIPELSSL